VSVRNSGEPGAAFVAHHRARRVLQRGNEKERARALGAAGFFQGFRHDAFFIEGQRFKTAPGKAALGVNDVIGERFAKHEIAGLGGDHQRRHQGLLRAATEDQVLRVRFEERV
jgi:hypothetical protein